MKVFIVCLSLAAVASASLEPAGYRPPGSANSQYLPPHLDHDQSHHHHHPSQAADTPALPPASQYLPPSYNRPSTSAAGFSSQYLPPRPQPQQRPPTPSSNYLPAADKPVPAPSNEYLPPPPPTPAVKPANDYLPPVTRPHSTVPASSYLPPTTTAAPAPSNEYLPPRTSSLNSEYLPPGRSRPAASTTPSPRISVVTVSPYKLDGPAYAAKQQPPQPQRPRPQYNSGLATSATSAPARAPGYPKQPGYPTEVKSFEQPADNYLPPLAGSSAANDGYRYGAAAVGGSAASLEQNMEPAKYDFEYRVSDEFGNDFGHQESRSGEQTHGVYSVLLPDGRKQIVRYQADEHGFKPRITYEEAASVLGPKAAGLASDGYDGNGLGPY